MKIKNNQEKSKYPDAKREFYATLNEIKDLYQNHGFLKARSLYEEMKKIHNWQMTYQSFSNYFNKEIKNKNSHPTLQAENLDSKKNEIIENSSQNIDQSKKEQSNEKDNITAIETTKKYSSIDEEDYQRFYEGEKAFKKSQEINKKDKA